MFWRSKTLLAKIETAYGTDAVPTGAANAILATNVTFAPMEGEDVKRNLERPFFGAKPSLPAGLYSTLTFDVELVGSGTLGAAPAFGPLLRMCSVAQTVSAGVKVEYNPITDNPESGSIYFAIDTTRHVMLGCRGTCVLKLSAQGIPVITFTMMGLFTVPTEQVKVNPDYSAFQAPLIASTANTPTFTIGGVAMILRDLTLDMANDVQRRLLIGQEKVHVVDKDETLSCTVEAVPVTTYNPYTTAMNSVPKVVQLIHGTAALKRWQLDVPIGLQGRLSGYQEQQGIAEWPLTFSPQPNAGNDQWKLSFL